MHSDWITPDWPAMERVAAVMTSRRGGVSVPPFDTMNLGVRVGDDATAVRVNRDELARVIGVEPVFLHQVHGAHVVRLRAGEEVDRGQDRPEADAAFTTDLGVACVVQVADCMPVLLASLDGRVVGAAHAGWRGLAAGVLDQTVRAMTQATDLTPSDLVAWMGPCIGPAHFEVGADVLDAFAGDEHAFREAPRPDGDMRWMADLPALAAARLRRLGLTRIHGGQACTVSEPLRYFSYRRDRQTGRHATAIWRR